VVRRALVATAVLAVGVLAGQGAAPAAAAVPLLRLSEARHAANNWFQRKPHIDDWNVSTCFRISRNIVQCRYWATVETARCSGNLRVRETRTRYYVKVLNCRSGEA